jgi:predicted transcriptional regulator
MEMCRKLVTTRKALGDSLGYRYCASPIWDMLLELYLAAREHRIVYFWSLCGFANVPFSTASRKVSDMEEIGLVLRNAAHRDRRGVEVALTDNGQKIVESLLDRLAQIYQGEPALGTGTAGVVNFDNRSLRSS